MLWIESSHSAGVSYLEMVNTVAAENDVCFYCFNAYDFKRKFGKILKLTQVNESRFPGRECFERTISECKDEYSKLHSKIIYIQAFNADQITI